MQINIGNFLTKRAMITPDKEGLVCDDLRLTFAQLNARANRLAHAMRGLGVKKGDRVGLLALNVPEYYEMLFGLGKIGAILVPVNYRLAGPEMAYILSDCGAEVFVFGEEYVEIVDSFRGEIPSRELLAITDSPPPWAKSYQALTQAAPDDEPEIVGGGDDVLDIIYTSGTTGRPKGAMLTHANNYWNAVSTTATLGDVGYTMLAALPLFHIFGLGPVPMLIHQGAKSVLLRSFDPKRFLELLGEEKITVFPSVPALLMLLKLTPDFEKYDWSSVKAILVGAAPVPVTLLNEYAEAGIEVRQLYGMTEAGVATCLDSDNAIKKVGSCGRPFFHTEMKLVDESGNEVGPGEWGEALIKADNVMKGYWNNEEATREAIQDGWMHSGDIARMDEDGFYYIMDRKKDMIISGGENIYPAEIEDYLLAHPKIADVAVIGFAEKQWGESVKAIVTIKQGEELSEPELIDWCQGRIGKFKIPKKVEFTDSIPRTPTGKILKRELREIYNK